jgi:hypothetical protein
MFQVSPIYDLSVESEASWSIICSGEGESLDESKVVYCSCSATMVTSLSDHSRFKDLWADKPDCNVSTFQF